MSTQQTRSYDYLRVRIRCELRTESPLHCGDGAALPAADSPWSEQKGKEGHINTVCRCAGGPYIPASTLRGSLRERSRDPVVLFGEARGETGRAGAVRVYDAFLGHAAPPVDDRYYNPRTRSTLRDGVSLDPLTGTAATGRLFAFEVVPTGSSFEVVIEADRMTAAQLAELLGLLDVWDGSAAGALGKGKTKGWGRVRLHGVPQVSVLTDADIVRWAADRGETPPHLRPIQPVSKNAVAPAGAIAFRFTLRPDSPLLVNEPARVRPKVNKDDHFPDLEYMRDPVVFGICCLGFDR